VKQLNLKTLSFDDLVALRDSAEAMIAKRVAEEKRDLEERLSRLSSFSGGAARKLTGSSLKGRRAVPKYRNPANHEETWAGRGMKPRWMQALLAEGHSMEEFAIPGAEAEATVRTTRGAGKKAARKATAKKVRGGKRGRPRKAA